VANGEAVLPAVVAQPWDGTRAEVR
jgi:hypothetical protein